MLINRDGPRICMAQVEKPIRVTVIVDGLDREEVLDGGSTVRQAISELLPDDEKSKADMYDLSTKDGPPLDPASVLENDDIHDGDVLTVTKKDGGGGRGGGARGCL